MGNAQTKEARQAGSPGAQSFPHRRHGSESQIGSSDPRLAAARAARGSTRTELSFLTLSANGNGEAEPPENRRETKPEREARKLEKERVAREKERERSMKEEHVDGGYLVTQGVYTGTEDFSKQVVRQLMIERRIAPFWRGLNDFSEEWTEHQLVAAVKGLPIPAADEIPKEEERVAESPRPSSQNLQNLSIPISSRSQSYNSDLSATLSPSHPAFSSQPLTSVTGTSAPQTSSAFRSRSKTLASLTTSLKGGATNVETAPKELQLPRDPYVHGHRMEAFLYKDASECPICFIYYPPYLNKTRCCDQPICSECFVQIKRPDPHPPEHEHADASNSDPVVPAPEAVDPDILVSEPANCPYCQQAEFGVTFEPPPFRRGLAYAKYQSTLHYASSAMSSSTSLSSTAAPSSASYSANRRRTTSVSANDATVITTDRVRPDWATKLSNARNHAARRSAAATALHTAAYLMNGSSTDTRSFGFAGRSRFGRSRDSPSGSGTATPSGLDREARIQQLQNALAEARGGREGSQSTSRGRSRMEDLEDMMMMEAIRLSLAAEEDRKRKEEKAAAKDAVKEAKKKEKEQKKADKQAKKSMYSASSSVSGSGSALSLSLPGAGRRRGNSGGSAYLREATLNNADKGKNVDRGGSVPIPIGGSLSPTASSSTDLRNDPNIGAEASPPAELSLPSPTTTTMPDKPSHLRQMSNASSPASSFVESIQGSLHNGIHGSRGSFDSPNVSGTQLGGHITPDRDGGSGTPGTEPMFNFQSLAAMIGREDEQDKDIAAQHVEHLQGRYSQHHRAESSTSTQHATAEPLGESIATLRDHAEMFTQKGSSYGNNLSTPHLTITPGTPAGDVGEDDKQLGVGMTYTIDHSGNVTQ